MNVRQFRASFRVIADATLILLACGAITAAQGIAHYPTPTQPAGKPAVNFDVVSVKLAPPDQRNGGVQPTPGYQGYICDNVPLLTDMTVAYGVTAPQIEGGPDWVRNERWNVEAKSDQPHAIPAGLGPGPRAC